LVIFTFGIGKRLKQQDSKHPIISTTEYVINSLLLLRIPRIKKLKNRIRTGMTSGQHIYPATTANQSIKL